MPPPFNIIIVESELFSFFFPKEFSKLENLAVFLAKGNKLSTEQAVAPLWNLKKLVELDLSNNGISSLSPAITGASSLSLLRLSGNLLTETTFPSLATLAPFSGADNYYGSRPSLYLNDNLFTEFPESLVDLKGLQVLTLDGNPIKALPLNLKDFKSLKVLMAGCSVPASQSDVTPEDDVLFPDLERLYISPMRNKRPQDAKLVLPTDLADTDVSTSDFISSLARLAFSIPPGPSTREKAFSQMLGSKTPSLILFTLHPKNI